MFFVVCTMQSVVYADTIYLKNGDILTGKLVAFQNGLCSFSTVYSSEAYVPMTDIVGLATDDEFDINFINGERVKGRFITDSKHKTFIQSDNLGKIQTRTDTIVAMVRTFPENTTVQNVQSIETTSPDSSTSSSDNSSITNASDQEFGAKPEESAPLDFLTGSTVLLSPGKFEVEMDVNYRNNRDQYRLVQVGYFERSSYSARSLEVGLSLRGGLADKLEGWIRVPYSYTRVEDVSTNAWVRDAESYRFGDISFGLQRLLYEETASVPAITASLSVSVPTGQKRYRKLQDEWRDPLDNGSGHWGFSPGISFVRTTDPAIIYGGFGYTYYLPDTIDGYYIEPGWKLSSYFGVGFALNEKLSLGGRVGYSYVDELAAEHTTVKGSSFEPMDLSLLASYRIAEGWVVSPQVTYGLNSDSGTPSLSMRLTRRF
jgi:hypothetical protein